MADEEKQTSDTTHFDMRPAKPDATGGTGLGILLLVMVVAVPALLIVTFLMMKPASAPGPESMDSAPGFFDRIEIKRPPELDGDVVVSSAPDESPGGYVDTIPTAPNHVPRQTADHTPDQTREFIAPDEVEPEWKRDIKEKLEKRISFDFVNTPLSDVVAFLTNLTQVNIVLDPEVVNGDDLPVTLKITDMKLSAALGWILRLVKLDHELTNEVVFISTTTRLDAIVPERLSRRIVYRVYDLREQVNEAGIQAILKVIRDSIIADWDAPEAILQSVDGRLIIRHRRQVVQMVEELMDEFLRASGAQAAHGVSRPAAGAIAHQGAIPTPMVGELPEWQRHIRHQWQKRISFDFVDTPLEDVVAFLTSLTSVNFVIDPAVLEGDKLPVTLKVSDMTLSAAIYWVLRLVDLDYDLKDEAVFISTTARLEDVVVQRRENRVIFRVYDLRKIANPATHFQFRELIQRSFGEAWKRPQTTLMIADGRLILRHRRIDVREVEALMDELVRASGGNDIALRSFDGKGERN